MYLDVVSNRDITGLDLRYALENMLIELVWGTGQALEEPTCSPVLKGNESVYRTRQKGLMEKPLVDPPSIAVGQKRRIEI